MIPTYNGVPLFGLAPRITVSDEIPFANQSIAFAGVNGVASIPLGNRGRLIVARGRLASGPMGTSDDLIAAENLFRSYRDGIPRTLVDTYGFPWDLAILEAFNPQGGRISRSPRFGFHRAYEAHFRTLI